MKVAISTDNGNVSAHFGRCPEFTILEIDDCEVKSRAVIPNPGHHPGFLPEFFEQQNVDAVVAGGGGQRARLLFEQKNIRFILGVTGSIDEVIEKLCTGELEGGESLCQPGAGKGYGVEKDECDHGDEGHQH
ncbi:dinitrogenase iron-molybdenum cofactor [candidate division KSB1 bacterium]|nr:dinitrogenase iron-molybdenum cofactor [candidate division KSB1 bacterium]